MKACGGNRDELWGHLKCGEPGGKILRSKPQTLMIRSVVCIRNRGVLGVCLVSHHSACHQNSEIWRRNRFNEERGACTLDKLSVRRLEYMQVGSWSWCLVWREEQDGTESLESQAMWLEVGQAGGMEAEEESSKGALRERPTLGGRGEQS